MNINETALRVAEKLSKKGKFHWDGSLFDFIEPFIAELAKDAEPVAEVSEASETIPYPHLSRLVDVGVLPVGSKLYLHPPFEQHNGGQAHTDHPLHHYDRTCPACQQESPTVERCDVPDGWQLVPKEAEDEMLEAWKCQIMVPVGSDPMAKARRAYKAMLAAAPKP